MDYMLQKNKLVLQENLDLQNIKNDIKKIYLFIHKIVSNNENKNEIPENILEYFKKSIEENQSKIYELSQKTLIINDINDILINVLESLQEFPKFINKEFNELKVIFENPNNPIIREIPPDIQKELDNLKKLLESSTQNINDNISSLKSDINNLKNSDSNFRNRINKISSDIKSLETDISKIKDATNAITDIKKNIKDIQNKADLLTVNINTATTNIKIINDSLSKTKSDVTTLQSSVTNITSTISSITSNIGNLLESFGTIRDNQTNTINQVTNINKKLILTQDDLANTKSDIKNNINVNISALKTDLNNTKNQITNNINVNINNIQNDLTNTRNEISNNITTNITTLRNDLNSNVTTLTNSINHAQTDIDDLRNNLVNTSNDISIIYTQANKNNIRTIYFKNAEIDNIVSKDFTLLSDKRLKKNIENIKYPKKLFELNAKKYNWIDSNKNDTGFIAQEVKELFPEMVNEDKNGILSVSYIKFIPLIVEIIKKQNHEILFLKIGFIILFIILIGIIIYLKTKNI